MRYFLEVAYLGTDFSGFQSQKNANSIQSEIEKALKIILKNDVLLTGSSRTDAGVHALQNFFHFDTHENLSSKLVYNLNAILPESIAIIRLIKVEGDAHCRFDAISRTYNYFIYQKKNPFLIDRSFYYPYKLDIDRMNEAAQIIMEYDDFTSFSKRNTQVKTFNCKIGESIWEIKDDQLVYKVSANRFLRGMVRALTATMLKIGRGTLEINSFRNIIESKDCTLADFAVPAKGLCLVKVDFPANYFK